MQVILSDGSTAHAIGRCDCNRDWLEVKVLKPKTYHKAGDVVIIEDPTKEHVHVSIEETPGPSSLARRPTK